MDIPLGGLDGANVDACRQLYYILLKLCQGTALNIIVNAGDCKGVSRGEDCTSATNRKRRLASPARC